MIRNVLYLERIKFCLFFLFIMYHNYIYIYIINTYIYSIFIVNYSNRRPLAQGRVCAEISSSSSHEMLANYL